MQPQSDPPPQKSVPPPQKTVPPPQKSDPPQITAPTIRKAPARKARVRKYDMAGVSDDKLFVTAIWNSLPPQARGGDFAKIREQIDAMFRRDEGKTTDPSGRTISLAEVYEPVLIQRFAEPGGAHALGGGNIKLSGITRKWWDGDQWLWVRDNPYPVTWRVYINAMPRHAAEIAWQIGLFISASKLDVGCKMGSYPILATSRDPIVCYLGSTEDRDTLLGWLLTWLADKPDHVSPLTVRFCVRAARGVCYVTSPPVGEFWGNLAEEWLQSPEGQEWLATQPRPRHSHSDVDFAFSGLIVEILASAWLRAEDEAEFQRSVDVALHEHAGLDPTTGAVGPQLAVIRYLTHKVFQ